jgi:hypothetical protein
MFKKPIGGEASRGKAVSDSRSYPRESQLRCEMVGIQNLNLNIFLPSCQNARIPRYRILREPVFERVKTRRNNGPATPGHPRWVHVAMTVVTHSQFNEPICRKPSM